ncbi:hypothetical protein [Wolbachia endosymbiont of Ctenocephalides felis wCfeT]|uniref:hypothetical protein n=1 Tax=Wolbachia endosymbiont of Ctenocephalides felis wCfeT TaxID=2732593 RepID=UPI001446317B|nr:hypothetical protein [Wolbachia endosymbiont of Ctenocephalides felis wCfeT]
MEAKEVKSFSKPTGYCFLSHTPEWIPACVMAGTAFALLRQVLITRLIIVPAITQAMKHTAQITIVAPIGLEAAPIGF